MLFASLFFEVMPKVCLEIMYATQQARLVAPADHFIARKKGSKMRGGLDGWRVGYMESGMRGCEMWEFFIKHVFFLLAREFSQKKGRYTWKRTDMCSSR